MISTADYNSFKQANPNLEPVARDFANMAGTGPDVISMSTLKGGQTPINVPPVPQLDKPENLSNFDINSIIAEMSKPTGTQATQDTAMSNTSSLYQKLFGKSQDKQVAETEAGIPEKNKLLTEATNRFRTTTMEQNQLLQEQGAIPLLLQERYKGTGATRGETAVDETGKLRQNAIKQYQVTSRGLFQQAEIANLRDDIAGAQAAVDKAIEYKYAPIEQELNYYKDFVLPTLKDRVTGEKADKLKALELQVNERTRLLTEGREDSKIGSELALTAMKLFPNDKEAQYYAQLAMQEAQKPQPDINKIVQLVGKYQVDPMTTAKSLNELEKSRLEIKKLNQEINQNNINGVITNPDASKYSGALSVVLGSSKLTKDQKNDLIRSVNNGEDPVAVLKNKAKDILGTDAKELTGYEVARQELQNISSIMDEYYANGGSTGIFSGNTEKVLNKLGEVRDPKLVKIATRLGVAIMNYRRAVTGTAASVQEDTNITSVFPGINKSEGLNRAITEARIQSFDSTIDSLYQNALGKSAYDAIKQAEIANNQPAQPEQPIQGTEGQTTSGVKYTIVGQTTPVSQSTAQPVTEPASVSNWKSMLPSIDGSMGGFSLNSFLK